VRATPSTRRSDQFDSVVSEKRQIIFKDGSGANRTEAVLIFYSCRTAVTGCRTRSVAYCTASRIILITAGSVATPSTPLTIKLYPDAEDQEPITFDRAFMAVRADNAHDPFRQPECNVGDHRHDQDAEDDRRVIEPVAGEGREAIVTAMEPGPLSIGIASGENDTSRFARAASSAGSCSNDRGAEP